MNYIIIPLVISLLVAPNWSDDPIEKSLARAFQTAMMTGVTSWALWFTERVSPMVQPVKIEVFTVWWWVSIVVSFSVFGLLMVVGAVLSRRAAREGKRMKVLGVMTARGGSKRVPGKNIADLGGKPLIAWSIEVGKATCDAVVTSTDSERIADVAFEYGSEVVMRPDEISRGEPGMQMKAIMHAAAQMSIDHGGRVWDAILLLQPTSPFRTVQDVATCFKMMEEWPVDSVVSVVQFPERGAVFTIGHAGRLRDVVDRGPSVPGYNLSGQPIYRPNGAIFLARTKHLEECGDWFGPRSYGYPMPVNRSVDIDTKNDLEAARALVAGLNLVKGIPA